jgi:YD repeat-containing protein
MTQRGQQSGFTLEYDANGQVTESNGVGMTYDAENRLGTMTLAPDKTITYARDGMHRLAACRTG